MRRKSTLASAMVLLAMPVDASADGLAAPARMIILIGADWCAPCVAELRELPVLANAAAPNRLVLAWTDRAARLPPEAARLGVTQVSLAKAREMLVRFGRGNSGLPLVVMLREDGTACGTLRESLSKEGIAELLASCGAERQALSTSAANRTD
uniref:TlpA family protein disulfide reductase n=1 Tax=Altererythrobacter segetis TaxID=1104773 RepID=UPI001409B5F5|nr:hypothetical protein [Altererythrobacter segetis]